MKVSKKKKANLKKLQWSPYNGWKQEQLLGLQTASKTSSENMFRAKQLFC